MDRHKLLGAFKWSIATEVASKLIQPIVFVVLARLLTPDDYGVMSAALMVIGFSQIFWEAGMGKALIQRQSDIQDSANVSFWINLVLAIIISCIIIALSEIIAEIFFHDQRVSAVLQVMSFQILFKAISSVHTALMQKEMKFKKLFWIRLLTVAIPGLASIPLAYAGAEYWSLVIGTLVGQFFQVCILWKASNWKPEWNFNVSVAKDMVRFGWWVGLSGFLAWFYIWADSLIIGMFLGSHDLGLYRTGGQFASMIFGVVFGPIVPVLYSYFSKIGGDKDMLSGKMQRVIMIIIMVSLPVAGGIYFLSEPIGDLVFGEKWGGVGFVIGVMSLVYGISWIVGMNGEAYRAMGKPSLDTYITLFALIFYIPAYIISIKYSFQAFIWTRFVLAVFAAVLHMAVLRKVLNINVSVIAIFFVKIAVIVLITTSCIGKAAVYLFYSSWQNVLFGGGVNALVFLMLGYFFYKQGFIREVLGKYEQGEKPKL